MPDDQDFHLETRLTSARGFFPYVAAALAIAGILAIIAITTTGVAARLLPMDGSYDAFIAPAAEDGSEALSLKTLQQDVKDKSASFRGTILNRTPFTISGLQAVIELRDKYGLPAGTVNVPVLPEMLPAQTEGTFEASADLDKVLGSYTVRFRLPQDGPFVRHKDERPDAAPSESKPQ